MKLKTWYCSNCFNVYSTKPEKCELTGIMLRQGYQSGCGIEYPLIERTHDIIKATKNWDTFEGLIIELILSDGSESLLRFSGKTAYERLDEVWNMIDENCKEEKNNAL